MRRPAFTILLLLCVAVSKAQKSIVKGTITDSTEKRSLHLATVTLLRKSDSTLVSFTRTNKDGKFVLPKTDTGRYVILVTYPRFADYMDDLEVKGETDMGLVNLTPASKLLEAVIIKTVGAIRCL